MKKTIKETILLSTFILACYSVGFLFHWLTRNCRPITIIVVVGVVILYSWSTIKNERKKRRVK